MAAEVPPPQGYLSAPEASSVSPRTTPPKVAPRTRPSEAEGLDFKMPPVPKPRRQKTVEIDDDEDCVTDL